MNSLLQAALILVRTVGRYYYHRASLILLWVVLLLVVQPPSFILSVQFAKQLVLNPVYYAVVLIALNLWTLNFLLFLGTQGLEQTCWQWRLLDLLPFWKRCGLVLPLAVSALAPILLYQFVLLYHFVGIGSAYGIGLTLASLLTSAVVATLVAQQVLAGSSSIPPNWQALTKLTNKVRYTTRKLLVNRYYQYNWGVWLLKSMPIHVALVKSLSLLVLSLCLSALETGRYQANLLLVGMCLCVALHLLVVRMLFHWTERQQSLFRQLPFSWGQLAMRRWVGMAALLLPEALLLLTGGTLWTGVSAWVLGTGILYAAYLSPFSLMANDNLAGRLYVGYILLVLALTAGLPGWVAAVATTTTGTLLLRRGYDRFSPAENP